LIRASILLWLVLIAGAGGALYQLKYQVIALEEQLTEIRGDIEADRDATAMLYAEWSYLNDPAQIEAYAIHHLGTRPSTVRDMVALADIPMAAGQSAPEPQLRPGLDGDAPPLPALTPEREQAPGARTPPADQATDGLLMAEAEPEPPPELTLVPAGRAAPQAVTAAAGPDDTIGALISNVLHDPSARDAVAATFPRGVGP